MIDQYADYEYRLAQVQLVLFTLGMGATLAVRDFGAVARRPRSLLLGLFMQLVVVPWVAVGINLLFRLPEGIAIGLILTAAMPGGATSKLFTYLGRGNAALSIGLTAVATLLTPVYVPLLLGLFGGRVIALDLASTLHVMEILGLCLLLPLAAGMTVARVWPRHRLTFSKWCVRVGLVVVLTMIVGALGSGRIRPAEHGWAAPAAIILFCLGSQQLSMLPFHLLGWPRADRMAVGIEVTMRNMNLALLLKATLFPDNADDPATQALAPGVLFAILFYAGTAMGAGLPQVLIHRRLAGREAPLAPTPP